MRYRVHRFEMKGKDMPVKLERFLNGLHGEVISIVPTVRPTFQFMGATAKTDSLLVVERTE